MALYRSNKSEEGVVKRIYLIKNGIENTAITGGYNNISSDWWTRQNSSITVSTANNKFTLTMKSIGGAQARLTFKNPFHKLIRAGMNIKIITNKLYGKDKETASADLRVVVKNSNTASNTTPTYDRPYNCLGIDLFSTSNNSVFSTFCDAIYTDDPEYVGIVYIIGGNISSQDNSELVMQIDNYWVEYM